MSIRILKATIQDKGELTTQGFLRVPAFLTRTGVFTYRKADGSIVRELRHPDDVFDPDSLATLQMAPLTDDHPEEFVTPANVKALSVGWIGENVTNSDGIRIGAEAIVAHGDMIAKVGMGKKELSCGYTADMIEESGEYKGEKYDVRQTNIKYNHVAIVDRGRAGPSVRLRMDAMDAIETNEIEIEIETNNGKENEGEDMKTIKIDGKDVEVTQAVYDAIMKERKDNEDKLAKQKADSDAEIMALKKKEEDEAEAFKKKEDKLQANLDSMEAKLKEHKDSVTPEKISQAVKTRTKIEDAARRVLGTEVVIDSKSDLEVMTMVIEKKTKADSMKDKSSDYVQARFDSIVDDLGAYDSRRTQLASKTDSRKDEEFDSKAARQKNADSDKELWKQPLSANKK